MAEGARLLSEYRVQTLSGVRIPSSPPVFFVFPLCILVRLCTYNAFTYITELE